ncbi:hypothetical protein [Cellulomonas palmilytica]|uniref:hypothetical protein n=1 Tax=Cellulomonas palmilytica TaxID=2608402 RepID=UPI001F1D62AC|nr:hypothetical protein [Cellulomonas palmilytica]UJP39358.1 hypothetical protein F1D97_13585 [Cellulomonas palmilytica]
MTAPTPRHARPRVRATDTMPPESVALGRVLVVLVLLGFLALGAIAGAAAARAASDDPTPYTVTTAGLTFPTPLPAHGHINVRTDDGTTHGLHLDPNQGHPGASWIGATFVPWSAFGITDGCVVWVQVSQYDEHYGEGGQPPVCLTTKEPTPCPTTPSPTSSPVPTTLPTPTASPEPTATPTSEPSPSTSPAPSPTPSPSLSTSPAPSPTPTSATPSAPPSLGPAPTTPPVAPSAAPSTAPPAAEPQPSSDATSSPRTPTSPDALAATGIDTGVAFIVIVLAVLLGIIAIGVSRNPRDGGEL